MTEQVERLTRLETLMEHVATREDIERAKNSILRWMVSTLLVSISALAAVIIAAARI